MTDRDRFSVGVGQIEVRRRVGWGLGVSLLTVAAAAALPIDLAAQASVDAFRPHAQWRTIETESFTVHFPAAAESWTRPLIARMESMHERVAAMVGRSPDRRVTVLVMDPVNQTNGFAIPLMDDPLTVLWPTPPGPRAGIGEHRGWGELLFVHEYAHLAHLTFPSRHPRERLLRSLLPLELGPVSRRSPRWVSEGYATYIEGRLTGRGRPHGVARPAFLRQRALEGRLPTYGQLSWGTRYGDGAAAYLAGSAYLEWLVDREGEESLNHLWRRMSARERRGFPEAFSGVFGGPPEELYGLFAVELTRKSLRARELLEEAGTEDGELWQLRRWATGEPALSLDGSLMAVVLFQQEGPDRLVVWETAEDEEAAERREEARDRLLARDSLDVPAVEWRPPPPKRVAALDPVGGQAHRFPRFLPDGERILTVRWDPVGDGTLRPDLFVWNHRTGALRRVTRGAMVRYADPSPDGTEAVGTRCIWGSCDVVRIDLASGTVSVLAYGAPHVVYYRPRWAPDGESVVAAVQVEGRWRLVSIPLEGAPDPRRRYIDPADGANRYDAAFLLDGRIVTVSDLGGIPNLELLDPETGAFQPLTRVLGEVAAPEPDPTTGWIHFLSMHSRGWDLRRIHPDTSAVREVTHLPENLWPTTRFVPPEPADTFATRPVPPARPYGWGRQRLTVLPAGGLDAGGGAFHLALSATDPVGRLGFLLQGAVGNPEAWAGASLAAVVRRFAAFDARAEGFAARQHPSGFGERTRPLDVRMVGGLLALEETREFATGWAAYRVGASGARLREPELERATRILALAEGHAALRQQWGMRHARQELRVHGAVGRTGDEGWDRLRVDARLEAGTTRGAVGLDVGYGRLGGWSPFEKFRVGGEQPLLFDPIVLRQQVAMPALPPLLLRGDRFGTARGSLRLGPWEPFVWLGSTDPDLGRWHRVAGVEYRVTLPAMPLVGLPAATARLGAARSFDEPFKNRNRGYFSLGLRP